MQAIADNVTENKITSEEKDTSSINKKDEALPLFSSDEIIFPDESIERPYTRYGYKISSFNFLVPEGTVSEIIQNQNIFPLPNSPLWIEGLINIRGNIVPVMNVDKLLKNLSTEKLTSLLVLNKSYDNSSIAILISDLPVSLEVNDSTTSSNHYPELLQDYVMDGFTQKGTDWVEFKPQELFKKLSGKTSL